MRNVLVVEDEDPLRRIITLDLAQRGYSVAEADSAATAYEVWAASPTPFDLILLDINLPDATGWDVLRQLHEEAPAKIPQVIVITAVRPIQRRIDEFHPAAVLLKPFPIVTLIRLIARVLEEGSIGSREGAAEAEMTDGPTSLPTSSSSPFIRT